MLTFFQGDIGVATNAVLLSMNAALKFIRVNIDKYLWPLLILAQDIGLLILISVAFVALLVGNKLLGNLLTICLIGWLSG